MVARGKFKPADGLIVTGLTATPPLRHSEPPVAARARRQLRSTHNAIQVKDYFITFVQRCANNIHISKHSIAHHFTVTKIENKICSNYIPTSSYLFTPKLISLCNNNY